jgi:uncharacterized membrane protein
MLRAPVAGQVSADEKVSRWEKLRFEDGCAGRSWDLRVIRRAGRILLTILATAFAFYSLRYLLPHVPHPARLTNFVTHRVALTIHAASASVALLIGPWQFAGGIRQGYPLLHRVLGRCYALAVLVGWVASVFVAVHAQTGMVASAGFLALGLCWITATSVAIWHITQGNVQAHRRWMVRSFALTAAAITLRIYLVAALALNLDFLIAYPIIAWLCWVPNAVGAELALRLDVGKGSRY